jgi:hypothetical protein
MRAPGREFRFIASPWQAIDNGGEHSMLEPVVEGPGQETDPGFSLPFKCKCEIAGAFDEQ